ncbi:cytochrome P450 [Thozetella sp. PMI_491]|nr:cytochrome P450 [Thozetella sp. PMI_491]
MRPPRLGERIPFVSNVWQFMTNKKLFIERAKKAFETSPIVRCRLGPMDLYLVAGGSNISTIFRSSFTSDPWITRILENSAGYSPSDVAKFTKDESGGGSMPRRGNNTPAEERIWFAMHRTYDESLLSAAAVNAFFATFQGCYSKQLAAVPTGEWAEVLLFDFLRENIALAATSAMMGPKVLEVNPDFIEAFWGYEKYVEGLAFGLPTWLNKPGVQARDRLRGMCLKWYEVADRDYDWHGADEDVDYEPVFGSRISRGLARWGKSFDFSSESMGAVFSLFLFGLHANTTPILVWVMIELIRDPKLFRAVKEEVEQVLTGGPNPEVLSAQKLASLPLLQSVFTETLRLHVGVLITRKCTEPVTIAGYSLPKGSIVQTPTAIAHLDETVWGTPEHPASQFWGARHLKEVVTKDETGQATKSLEYSMAGRAGSFFPYGGGTSTCAGRNIAKQEVMLAVAMMVSRLEIEFVEWVKQDGSRSDRPAEDDMEYANSVAAPPDRDMKIRWRRLW